MVLSELKKQVDFLCDTGHGDNPVLVTLSESSIGSRAATASKMPKSVKKR